MAFKPQNVEEALDPLRASFSPEQMLVSLLAGTTIDGLRRYLPDARLARLIPNVGTAVGRGVMGLALDEEDENFQTVIEDLFSPIARVVSLLINALHGSFYHDSRHQQPPGCSFYRRHCHL